MEEHEEGEYKQLVEIAFQHLILSSQRINSKDDDNASVQERTISSIKDIMDIIDTETIDWNPHVWILKLS
jgi:hypothetical protein